MTLPEGFIVVGPDATREECIAAWVKNLRNPNVRQARRRLMDENGAMCCLGVMEVTLGAKIATLYGTHPSIAACERLGLYNKSGSYDGGCLVNNNDVERFTLSEIADLIESRPPGLFVESST